MVIILAVCIPVTAIVTGFFTLKAVQLGLRWQMETKQEKPPTMETPKIPNPIAPIIEAKQERETASIFNEWVYGPNESR
ncbi:MULTISPECIES: hypothetical protein [unclassified Peribacillus]|uniref:hypothetical protein n=1 Tax=unclassified Peribacillus TaxID=2675266 RepID=UPI003671DF14